MSNQTIESENSGVVQSQTDFDRGSQQQPFPPSSQQNIDDEDEKDNSDKIVSDLESNQKKLLTASKVPQRRATINIAKPSNSMASTTFSKFAINLV